MIQNFGLETSREEMTWKI